jgi:hypothetical protein
MKLKLKCLIGICFLQIYGSFAQQLYVGAGITANAFLYKVSTFDTPGTDARLEEVFVTRIAPSVAVKFGLGFNLNRRTQLSIVTYPSVGIAQPQRQANITYELPVLLELFYGRRTDGYGLIIGVGGNYGDITKMPSHYATIFSEAPFRFTPQIIGYHVSIGVQHNKALMKFNFTQSLFAPFSDVSNETENTFNEAFLIGATYIYQLNRPRSKNKIKL